MKPISTESVTKAAQILKELAVHSNTKNIEGMKRFGIEVSKCFGISMPLLKEMAKTLGKNHEVAIALWETGYREARHLAVLISDSKQLTKVQMNSWVKDFDSWDICDGTCLHLFRKHPDAFDIAFDWVESEETFIRRAGLVLIATLAVHDKKRDDSDFLLFFPVLIKFSTDERNFVKKAVNWTIRQIGKRSKFLNTEAIELAYKIKEQDSKSARWIASDAIRELESKVFKK